MCVSLLLVLLLPKFMSVRDYSIWQLYLFYYAYLGFLHFGWLDGIYLRYGGYEFSNLPKKLFFGQLIVYVIAETFLASFLWFSVKHFVYEEYKLHVLTALSVTLVLMMIYTYICFVLQMTNRIKEYAVLTIFERFLFLFLIGICFFAFGNNYNCLMMISVVNKIFACLLGLYFIKNIFCDGLENFTVICEEGITNIKIGSKLMMANIAGIAILGIVRFAISQEWSIETFGKLSLAISFSNFVMLFMNAISIVLFPTLKRLDKSKLPLLFLNTNKVLSYLMIGLLVLYYPLKFVLILWIPKYAETINYLAIIFPIFVFECKVVLLTNTYFKALRKEKTMMQINMIVVMFSVLLSAIGSYILHNLYFMLYSILVLFVTKSLFSEIALMRFLNITNNQTMYISVGFSLLFLVINNEITNLPGCFLLYTVFYFLLLYIERKSLTECIRTLNAI